MPRANFRQARGRIKVSAIIDLHEGSCISSCWTHFDLQQILRPSSIMNRSSHISKIAKGSRVSGGGSCPTGKQRLLVDRTQLKRVALEVDREPSVTVVPTPTPIVHIYSLNRRDSMIPQSKFMTSKVPADETSLEAQKIMSSVFILEQAVVDNSFVMW